MALYKYVANVFRADTTRVISFRSSTGASITATYGGAAVDVTPTDLNYLSQLYVFQPDDGVVPPPPPDPTPIDTHWQTPVNAITDLPATNNTTGDVRLVINQGQLYAWSGTAWSPISGSGGGGGGNVPINTADTFQPFNLILLSNGTVKAIPAGITPPTAPTGLAAVVKLSSVTLTWNTGSGSGIKYAVLRNGIELAQVLPRTYRDLSIVSGQTYSYRIQTVDSYSQRSPQSSPVSAVIDPSLNVAPAVAVKTWPLPTDGYPLNGKLKIRVDATDADAQSLLFSLTADGGTLTPDPGPDADPTVWWYSP